MAYKVFANGFPLQASELNENLMQQSIAVFTDATARDAAITAPVHGQFAYLTGSDSLTKYDGSTWVTAVEDSPITTEGDFIIGNVSGEADRLAIGANGTVLSSNGTTASWESPVGSMTLLSTTSLSGTSTSITGISQDYQRLYITGENVTVSTNTILRLRANNATTYAAQVKASATVTQSTQGDLGQDSWSNSGNGSFVYTLDLYTTTIARKPFLAYGSDSSTMNNSLAVGDVASASAITSFTITTANGTANLAGTVKIYGVK